MSVVTRGVSSFNAGDYDWITSQVDKIPGSGKEVLERVCEIVERIVRKPNFRDLATLSYWDIRGLPPPITRMGGNVIPLGCGLDFCQEPFQKQTLFYLDVGNDESFKVNPLSGDLVHGVNLEHVANFSYVGGRRFEPFAV